MKVKYVFVTVLCLFTLALSITCIALAAKPLEKVHATEPTCESEGCFEHYENAVGICFDSEDGIKAHDKSYYTRPKISHNYVFVEGRAATCTENGVIAHYHCDMCNKNFSVDESKTVLDNVVIAASHTYALVSETPATCTENGIAAHYHCNVCNKNFSADENKTLLNDIVLPAGHRYNFVEGTTATCTGNGIAAHYHCDACNKDFSADENKTLLTDLILPAKGHNYELVDATVTCTKDGEIEHYHCEDCGKNFSADESKTEIDDLFASAIWHRYTDNEYICDLCGRTEYLTYTQNDGGQSYSVTGIREGAEQDIEIPLQYQQKRVTSIADNAFRDSSGIVSISIPDSVTSIGDGAFYNCSRLINVNIPDNITKLGYKTFYGCDALTSININRGAGTAMNPYKIGTLEEFNQLRTVDTEGVHYELISSIDLGSWNNPFEFKGHLNGNGYKITYRQQLEQLANFYGGLFSKITNATIENLYLDVSIQRPDISSNGTKLDCYTGYVGALAGMAESRNTISKISVSGQDGIYINADNSHVGGIIGALYGGTIDQCVNEIAVCSRGGTDRVGGIVGYAEPRDANIDIKNCYNLGELKILFFRDAWAGSQNKLRTCGGIAGQLSFHQIRYLHFENCYSNAKSMLSSLGGGGYWGFCRNGGIYGDVNSGQNINMEAKQCYWNPEKVVSPVINMQLPVHEIYEEANMTGTFENWSAEIWQFSDTEAPKLKWELV